MNSLNENNEKYINILNRIHKKISKFEAVLIIKKQYFTNNIFYYLLCIILRFIYLISFLGKYYIFFDENKTYNYFQKYIQKLSFYNIIKDYKISFQFYLNSSIIIFILSLIRVLINAYIFKRIKDYTNFNVWPLPNKYLILIDHIRFAIFPYLVEYLSFPYYIIVLTNEFISSFDESDKTNTIILIILNTLLIILYNFDLFWDMICINKIFTITIYDIPPNNNFNFNRNNHFSYKCSIYIIYILIIFQNISIFLNIENFINNKKLFRIIITIFILILLLIIIYKLLNQFDYNNYILYIMNISFLFCFYTIFLDLIIASFLDKTFHLFKDIIYALVKIIISYIVFSLIMLKRNHLLQTNIVIKRFAIVNY